MTPDETRQWLNAPCVCGHARGVHGCWHARMQVVCTCSEFQAATERTINEKFAVDPDDGAHPNDLRAENSFLRSENLALRADLSALKGERGRMESALMSIKSQCAGHADAFSERVYLIAVDAINHKEPT